MTPARMLGTVIRPTLAWMGPRYQGPEAELLLLAVQQQEDAACTRCQAGGPARGAWMFEPAGVRGVLHHERTAAEAARLMTTLRLPSHSSRSVCAAMRDDDRLACAFARLLLWTLPDPLPRLGEGGVAWAQYVKAWRPGRPRPLDWPHSYAAALAAIQAAAGPPAARLEARVVAETDRIIDEARDLQQGEEL